MVDWSSHATEEWAVVSGAPVIFLLTISFVAAGLYAIMRWGEPTGHPPRDQQHLTEPGVAGRAPARLPGR
jgi:hypothetical protein